MQLDEQDLTLIRGTTFDFELDWQSENDQGAMVPVDITGCSATLQIRSQASNDLLVECTSVAGDITITDATLGQLQVHIAPEKTSGQNVDDWGDARWELRITFPSGDVYSLVRGWAKLMPGVVG